METQSPQPPQITVLEIDKQSLQRRFESLRMEQNLSLGVLGGSAGGLLGAVLWTLITYYTNYQIGWMAVGVGLLAGFGVRLGKGFDPIYGFVGAAIALVSVGLGNFLTAIGYLGRALGTGYFETLFNFDFSQTFRLMQATFHPLDVLFYALAAYFGYRYSFRRISQAELLEGVTIHERPYRG